MSVNRTNIDVIGYNSFMTRRQRLSVHGRIYFIYCHKKVVIGIILRAG